MTALTKRGNSLCESGARGKLLAPPRWLVWLVGRRRRVLVLVDGGEVKEGPCVRWVKSSELPFVLAAFADPDDLVAWCPQGLGRETTHSKDNLDRVYYVVVDLDDLPIPAEELPEELERRGLPKPWAVLGTPGGGAHVYWRLHPPLSLHFVPGETLEEYERRRKWGVEFYEETARLLVEALADLGADAKAADATHLFRLNAVLPVYESNTRTSLTELSRAARAWLRGHGHRKKRWATARPEPRSLPARRQHGPSATGVWDSPGIRWLREHVIPEGCRNTATVALAIALLHDGHTEDEAVQILSEWAATHTVPVYPGREIRDTVKSLARRWRRGEPLGLLPQRLLEIQDVRGETMGATAACATRAALPPGTAASTDSSETRQRKPLSQRQNKPRIYWLLHLLRRQPHDIPRTTRRRLAKVEEHLRGLQGHLTTPSPSQRQPFLLGLDTVRNPVKFLLETARAGLWSDEEHSLRSVGFWSREEPRFWGSLVRAAAEFLSALWGCAGAIACSDDSVGGEVSSEETAFLQGVGLGEKTRYPPKVFGGLVCLVKRITGEGGEEWRRR